MPLNIKSTYKIYHCGIIHHQVKNLDKKIKFVRMLGKIVMVCIILGAASTEPIRVTRTIPNDLSTLLSDKAELFEIAIKPETFTSILNIFKSLIGYKVSALKVMVQIVNWLASNFIGIAIGGILALGICKLTGKCNLNLDETLSKLGTFITSERLEMAQNFLMNAISRFEQDDEEEEIE